MASDNGVFPGRVIFLALGGLAFWINYYFTKRPPTKTRKTTCSCGKNQLLNIRQEEEAEVHDGEEDYFSQLPDDVLSFILSNLTVRDAVRTSILSPRWKNVFASMPTLRFQCLTMFGVHPYHPNGSCPCYQEKLLKGTNQLLQLYSGRRVPNIHMTFCMGREFSSELDHWLRSISRLGVETLYINFACHAAYPISDLRRLLKISFEPLSQASSLKHLLLYNCILLWSSKVRFSSLTILTLQGVVLANGHLEGILSSCLNLKQLNLVYCRLPYKLQLTSVVTSVFLLSCDGVEEIYLWAANLRTLACDVSDKLRIFFSFVPVLEYVSVDPRGAASVSYVFGDFARNLPPQVKSLTIEADPYRVRYFPTEMKTFRNLRQLSLDLLSMEIFCDMAKLSPILTACPLLQRLSLVAVHRGLTKEGREIRMHPLSPTCHTELKEMTFHGFYGTEVEIEFVLYILRSSIVLERMFLSPGYRFFYKLVGTWNGNLDLSFDQRKRNSIQEKLFGQAISGKALVIIQ